MSTTENTPSADTVVPEEAQTISDLLGPTPYERHLELSQRAVFRDEAQRYFAEYAVTIEFVDKLIGGTPKDKDIMLGFIKTKLGDALDVAGDGKKVNLDDIEVQRLVKRNMLEMHPELLNGLDPTSFEDMGKLETAIENLVAEKHVTGFKRDQHGLYIESRHIKAMLKEVTSIQFAGERWGPTSKGPKAFLSERVFVEPLRIYVNRAEPDGVETVVGHINGPQGPRSTLSNYEYVDQGIIHFTIKVWGDALELDKWAQIVNLAQLNGLGAMRSQGHGTFFVTRFDKVNESELQLTTARPTKKK
jgi:hypothetical protein